MTGRWPRRLGFEALEARLVLSFAAPVIYPVGVQTSKGLNGFGPQVITADFNRDGKPDLAETNTADGTLSILAGKGDGTFQSALTFNTGLGVNGPVWLAAADFNADGKLDLAVEGVNSVSLLMGKGDGTFGDARVYAAGLAVRGGLAVGDFFGNGRQDVAVVAFTSNNLQILPNNGDGTFGTPVVVAMPSTFSLIRSVAVGDFFGNGRADLAIAGGTGSNNIVSSTNPAGVALFQNDGSGHFTYKAEYVAVVTPDPSGGNGQGDTVNPEHVNVADLNGDGKPDLVLSLYDHNIDVFLNKGDGTYLPAVGYTTETPGSVGGYPRGVSFADVNHDGKLDILTDNFGEPVPADQSTPQPGSVGVLYGNGDGSFRAPLQYTPYEFPGGIAVGDFNGDGLPDLAVTQNYTGHSVAVLLNQPNTPNESPKVTAVSPASGPASGGTLVTITGTNFLGTTQVNFGGVPAAFTVGSNNSITATAPAQTAGTVDITVYDAGASPTGPADQFTFTTVSHVPSVAKVDPSYGPTYGGTLVTITGINFTGATSVKFGTVAASFQVVSSTSITATAPAEGAGVVDITVTVPNATSTAVLSDRFTYQSPVLSTVAVTPSTATLSDGASQLFVAVALDQFGKALASQPAFTWSVDGGGSITTSGLYTAPASGTGSSTVKAVSAAIGGVAHVNYSPLTSDVWTGLGTSNNWSDSANWSAHAVPTASTAVIFNNTSKKNAVVDPAFLGSVASVQITSIYGGTITLGRSLTVLGTFTEASGVFDSHGFNTIVSGLATFYGGTFLGSTNTQVFSSGLAVAGGTFTGSTGMVVAASLSLTSGVLNAPSGVLNITGGNFTVTGGLFQADHGSVVYTGINAAPVLSLGVGLITFHNFTDALTDNYPAGMTITGTLKATGTFSWKAGAGIINGTIEAQGDVNDENHGGIGNPLLTLDGSGDQTIEDLTGAGGGQFRTITINKSGGIVSLACNPIVFTGLSLIAGSINTGLDSWIVTGPIGATLGLNLGNIVVDGNNVTVTGDNLQVANIAFVSRDDRLTAPKGNLAVSGSWNNAVGAGFIANGGTVIFDGANAIQFLADGGGLFNNLMIYVGATLELQADAYVEGTFTNYGTFLPNGHKILK